MVFLLSNIEEVRLILSQLIWFNYFYLDKFESHKIQKEINNLVFIYVLNHTTRNNKKDNR